MYNYDAFLSYNSKDGKDVESIALALSNRGLRLWFDQWDLQPGKVFLRKMEEGMKNSKVIVVFIGPSGMGVWHTPEMLVALNELVQKKKDVIPALLPGIGPKDERIPVFLRILSSVEFQNRLDDEMSLARLEWAITGENPMLRGAQAPVIPLRRAGPTDYAQDALDDLLASLSNDNITFFIGRNAPNTITQCDITNDLLQKISLIGPTQTHDILLPPLDLAASYYAVKNTDNILEKSVIEILEQRAETIPTLYNELAELLRALTKRIERRGRHRQPQLIITSNFDTLLEKALLWNGIAFTRLVQYRTGKKIDVHEYAKVTKLSEESVSIESKEGESIQVYDGDQKKMLMQMDSVLTDSRYFVDAKRSSVHNKEKEQAQPILVDKLTQPILYKLYGSQDLPNSSVLSRDQHFDYVSSAEDTKIIPEQIGQIISTTPIVYLGCRILDPDFLWSNMLLRRPLAARDDKALKKYMVHPRMVGDKRDCGHKIGLDAWEKIRSIALSKYVIEMIDDDVEGFVRRLRERVQKL